MRSTHVVIPHRGKPESKREQARVRTIVLIRISDRRQFNVNSESCERQVFVLIRENGAKLVRAHDSPYRRLQYVESDAARWSTVSRSSHEITQLSQQLDRGAVAALD